MAVRGKRRYMGLGGYPAATLAEARRKAMRNRRVRQAGGDPLVEARRQAVPTFDDATATVIALKRPTMSNRKDAAASEASVACHASPLLGRMLVSEITSGDVLRVLEPIWTARRVKQRIGTVMDWAVARGYRTDNPGAALGKALPKTPKTKEHHKALPYAKVPAALVAIRESTANAITRLAFEFLILTAARSGEVRGAVWDEVDLEARTWAIPAARMKARHAHRVPLSRQALAVLEQARGLDNGSGLVFPTPRSGGQLSDMAFTAITRRLEIPAVPHGFRSSFKDWSMEQTDTAWAISEAALAHTLGNATEAAYAWSDLFDRRRELMQRWADYVVFQDGSEAAAETEAEPL